jgi:hypothetical protein
VLEDCVMFTKDYVLARERGRLKVLIEKGVPADYYSVDDYMLDVAMDFSWDGTSPSEYDWCLKDPEWLKLAGELREKRGLDIIGEFTKNKTDDEEAINEMPNFIRK